MSPARLKTDGALFSFITRGWSDDQIGGYFDNLQRHESAIPREASAALQNVDAKSSGLLTHVSMMIAGLGLLAPLVASNDIEVGVIVIEIGLYLLIALGCLRCLSIVHSKDMIKPTPDLQKVIAHELLLRRELYAICNRASIVLTVLVFLLLPVLYIWTPEH